MKKLLIIFFTAFMAAQASEADARGDNQLAVVELFTSQGCSSCPPADAFLGELSMRSDVLALAYHVDYWNYIGWDDPFSKAEYTKRQRLYAQVFNSRYVYTPQMIVSGEYETSGNNRRKILRAIEKELAVETQVDFELRDDELIITGSAVDQGLIVYQVDYVKEVETKVRRGENRGKTLTDYNIVTNLEELAFWDGNEKSLLISRNADQEGTGRAIFVQDPRSLRILNAVVVF